MLPPTVQGRVIDVSARHDVTPLLELADGLITDYSSVMFDYALLDRPLVFFTYDYDEYVHEGRGTYFDLLEHAPGPVVRTEDAFHEAIKSFESQALEYAKSRKEFVAKFGEYDQGNAAQSIVEQFSRSGAVDDQVVRSRAAGHLLRLQQRQRDGRHHQLVAPDGASVQRAGPPGAPRRCGAAPEGRVHELAADLPFKTTTLYAAHPPSVRPVRGLKDKLNLAEQRRRAAREAGMQEQAAKMSALFRAAKPGGVVIVTQVWAMEWVALADTAGLTVIGMSHESFDTCRKSSRFGRVKRFYEDVDRMLTLTREDADRWIRQRMDNVGFMPNPLPFFPDVPSDRSAKCVVSIGRLHEEKGVDLLLEAWAKVAPQHPDWTLRIYGSGEEEEALRKQAAELGITTTVAWMGRTSDVPGALRESAVFALSSRGEGFPLAPMEAMATAVPCVAFDVAPGVHEIISDGVDGLLAPPAMSPNSPGISTP